MLDAFDGHDLVLFGDDPHRIGQGHDLDAFIAALGDLVRLAGISARCGGR
jgi:hypothetical protein